MLFYDFIWVYMSLYDFIWLKKRKCDRGAHNEPEDTAITPQVFRDIALRLPLMREAQSAIGVLDVHEFVCFYMILWEKEAEEEEKKARHTAASIKTGNHQYALIVSWLVWMIWQVVQKKRTQPEGRLGKIKNLKTKTNKHNTYTTQNKIT